MRITLKQITKRFGATVALQDVSLTVNDGELMALVGPSGCGKTTILRLIAGFEAPDAGDVLFDERSVVAVPPERRACGLVFQNYALFPHMNVLQNVAYGLKFVRSPHLSFSRRGEACFAPTPQQRGTERVRELLKLVGLEGLEHRMPSELSAGQQQRVALARALAPNPKILLLDEPLSALDAKLRERLRMEIKKIQRILKITTLYITHDQEEALAVADRVAVMNIAHIEQIGTPQEVYNAPAREFVARFIGRGNLLSGQIIRRDDQGIVLSVGGSQIRACSTTGEVGQAVTALVRPERIHLVHREQPIGSIESKSLKNSDSTEENVLMGVICGLEFAGDALWIHVETAGGVLTVKGDAPANAVSEGQVVSLGFSASDVSIVPASDRRSPSTG